MPVKAKCTRMFSLPVRLSYQKNEHLLKGLITGCDIYHFYLAEYLISLFHPNQPDCFYQETVVIVFRICLYQYYLPVG